MKLIYSVLAFLILVSCQSVSAQPRPAISTKYTNSEIEKLMSSYRITHSHDAAPLSAVQSRFLVDFPSARDIEWETALDIYEVDFEIGRTDYEAYYDKDGNLLTYSFEIREADLPAIVKNAAIAKYPDYRFEDMEEIRKGSEILYKVELERHKTDVRMLIKNDGTIVKERFD